MCDILLKNLKVTTPSQYLAREFWKMHRKKLQLKLHTEDSSLNSYIRETGLHRPGLAMAGFISVYSSNQIQVVGHTEWNYLESLGPKKRQAIFENLSQFKAPMWVVTHNQAPHKELLDMCQSKGIPLFSTPLHTFEFTNITQRILEIHFAPTAMLHACLVDVYGVGMLYIGKSNVGKSECVLDLVERGHRLVADDVVHLSRIGSFIVGRPDSLLKHHMEIRGIGIIDIRSMFGIHAVRRAKKVEIIVELQSWKQNTTYERTGLSPLKDEIMNVQIPRVTIPVSPGKNITVISEVIAMNYLMRINGQNVATKFNEHLLETIQSKKTGKNLKVEDIDKELLDWSQYE